MFASEFVSGLIVFLYQKRFVKKSLFKVENQDKYMNIELIRTKNSVRKVDSIKKMIFYYFVVLILILFNSLFQFIQKQYHLLIQNLEDYN